MTDEVGGFGSYEVVAVSEGFAQRVERAFRWLVAERVQGGELFLEFALGGH